MERELVRYVFYYAQRLAEAVRVGNPHATRFLVQHGRVSLGRLGHFMACSAKLGRLRIVQCLVELGARNSTALSLAARHEHWEIVYFLAKSGVDVHVLDDYALRASARAGKLHLVQLLLELGANVHAEYDNAVRWAARNGHLAVVQALVQAGADVHASEGYALRWASRSGHFEVVQYLVALDGKFRAEGSAALWWRVPEHVHNPASS